MRRFLVVPLFVMMATASASGWIEYRSPNADIGSGAMGPPTTWWETMLATWDSMLEVDNSNGRQVAIERAADELRESIRRAGIALRDDELVNPMRMRHWQRPGLGILIEESGDPIHIFERQRGEIAARHPEHRDVFRLDRSLMQLARDRAQAAEERAMTTALRYRGWAPAWTATLAGSAFGSFGALLGGLALAAAIGIGAIRQPYWIGLAVALGVATVNVVLTGDWWREVGVTAGWGRAAWLALMFSLICSAGWLLSQAAAYAIMGKAPPSGIGLRRFAAQIRHALDTAGNETRLLLAFSAVGILSNLAVFSVFDPFGKYRWSDQEWLKFATILFGPVVLGLLAVRLFAWATRAKGPGKGRTS
jgi:hypothetical protein